MLAMVEPEEADSVLDNLVPVALSMCTIDRAPLIQPRRFASRPRLVPSCWPVRLLDWCWLIHTLHRLLQ